MPGTGKTSVAATLADATCRRGERCQFFSFEESPSQIMRNMKSIGLDLQQWVKKGLLQFQTVAPFHATAWKCILRGPSRLITEFEPQVVIVDQMSAFGNDGHADGNQGRDDAVDRLYENERHHRDVYGPDLRRRTVALTDSGITSLVDTWLVVRDLELNGERNRGLHILKSRGMAHSNQVREFIMSERGIELKDIYIGPGGMLTGSARVAQEARERAQQVNRNEEVESQQLDLKRKHDALEGQIAALRAEYSAEEARIGRIISHDKSEKIRSPWTKWRWAAAANTTLLRLVGSNLPGGIRLSSASQKVASQNDVPSSNPLLPGRSVTDPRP